MTAFMKELRGKVTIGVVGGSDTNKIKEQLGDDCESATAAPASLPAQRADAAYPLRAPKRSTYACTPVRRRHRRVRLVLLAERPRGLQGARPPPPPLPRIAPELTHAAFALP